jgi:hypothetical protein
MSKHQPRLLSLASTDGNAVPEQFRAFPASQRSGAPESTYSSASPASAESDQLSRDIADIERAAAALRRAEPALESWSSVPVYASPKPRPVWLLVAVLWFSTALVTLGAVAAITALVG